MMTPAPCHIGIRLVFLQFWGDIIPVYCSCKPQTTRPAAFSLQTGQLPNPGQRMLLNFAAAILVTLYGAFTPVAARDIEAEMEAENQRWLAVYVKRDAQAFAAMYTPDAVIVPQGGPPIKGRTAIVQFWDKMFKNGFQHPTLEIIDLYQEEKLAYQTCRWSVLKTQADSLATPLTGNTLRIFERQRDGRWLIKVHMSNTD